MKILLFSAMYPPIRTGTSFYAKNIETALCKKGHQVKVITLVNKDSDVSLNSEVVIKLSAVHFPLKNYFKHFRIASVFPLNYIKAFKLAKEFQPDVILLINHYLDLAFIACYVAHRLNLPLYISVGTQLQSLNPVRNRILNILDRLICGTLIFPNAKKIIAWDKEIERYINEVHKNRFSQKQVIIPFGVNGNPDDFERAEKCYDLRQQLIGVGGVIDHRNYLFQVRVFKELLSIFPEYDFKIIGHVYNKDALNTAKKMGIADKVIFMGEQPHDIVLKEMSNSDLHWMMLDGLYKGLGTANLEAMLLGVPVVSNIPENLFGEGTLVDMESFIHTDGRTVDVILTKLISVLKSKEKREFIGLNGKRFVIENMNWEKIAEAMTHLFDNE